MKKIIHLLMLAGVLTKVETITYQDGTIVERTYDKPNDVVPAEIKWVKSPKPLHPDQVIEHREVQLSNYWQRPNA